MSRIEPRTLFWNGRGKRNNRESLALRANDLADNSPQRYSFGNPEAFDELHSITSKFSEHQLKLAERTGFGLFARHTIKFKFDKAFCTWLLGIVDCAKQTLNLPNGGSIRIFPDGVSAMFSVPNNGLVPWHYSLDKSGGTIDAIQQKIGVSDVRSSCIEAAEYFLRNSTVSGVSFDDEAFMVAFVVYTMGVISDVKRPTHLESQNFLPALREVDACSSFDWARCIFDDVIAMCHEAQADVRKKLEPCRPAGCLLFLQIFYLDNHDYGMQTIQNMKIPRLLQFNSDIVARLIHSDCSGLKGKPPARVFGAGKIRQASDVVYKRVVGCEKIMDEKPVRKGKDLKPTDEQTIGIAKVPKPVYSVSSKVEEEVANVDMYTKVVVKAFKAKCLKHLTAARLAIELETDDLIKQLKRESLTK